MSTVTPRGPNNGSLIPFETVHKDAYGMFATGSSSIVAPIAGTYWYSAQACVTATAAAQYGGVAVRCRGATLVSSVAATSQAAGNILGGSASDEFFGVNAGDGFDALVSSPNLAGYPGSSRTFLTVQIYTPRGLAMSYQAQAQLNANTLFQDRNRAVIIGQATVYVNDVRPAFVATAQAVMKEEGGLSATFIRLAAARPGDRGQSGQRGRDDLPRERVRW